MELINKLSKDKIFLLIFIAIIILSLYVRFNNLSEVGYWNDDQATLPAGLMWFYPNTYFPGLNYGNPPLGDMIIGAGCMLSNQDFSGVSQVKPFFYPDRFFLLGEALSNADFFCHLPMYVFGLLFLAISIVFAFSFFGKYSALFLTAFFAFYPQVLLYSRWIKPDIIFWTLVMLFMFFLLKFYYSDKDEYKLLVVSSLFLGLSFAAKFTSAILFLLVMLIIIDKYKQEFLSILKIINKKLSLTILEKIEYKNPKKLIYLAATSLVAFIFSALVPYKFNPKNLIETQQIYKRFNPDIGGVDFNPLNIFETFKEFIFSINAIDAILFIISIYVFIFILIKKDKTKLEKFILFLFLILLIAPSLFSPVSATYRAFPFLLSVIFIISLLFSDKEYSIFRIFNIKNERTFFLIFIIIYIVLSSSIAIQSSPYFQTKNHAICIFSDSKYCQTSLLGFRSKIVADYFKPILNDQETFIGEGGATFFYLKSEQGILDHQFNMAFQQQLNRYPNFIEKIQYFRPNNQTVRYLVLSPDYNKEPVETKSFKQQYKPNEILKLKNQEVAYIYDLNNLTFR